MAADQLNEQEIRCLLSLHSRPLERNLVRVMLLGIEEPEKVLAHLQERGLVVESADEWSLTDTGRAAIEAVIEERERQLRETPDQAGAVGYGRDLHLLRRSSRKDRGPDRAFYAVCGADSPNRSTHPIREIDPKRPLDQQITCQRCLRSVESGR